MSRYVHTEAYLITYEVICDVSTSGMPSSRRSMEAWTGSIADFIVHWNKEEEYKRKKSRELLDKERNSVIIPCTDPISSNSLDRINNMCRSLNVRYNQRMVIVNSEKLTSTDLQDLEGVL